MPNPRYIVSLRASDGSIRIIKSDGEDCTEMEANWLRTIMTRSLREMALAENPESDNFKEKNAKELGTTRRGETFEVDQVILDLEAERSRQGVSRAAVARALFMSNESKLGAYVRGRARPHMGLLRMWAYVLGQAIMTVPKPLQGQVEALIQEWRNNAAEQLPVEVEVEK